MLTGSEKKKRSPAIKINKLTTANFTIVILIAVMGETVFDQVFRFAAWATWH
jgi:hypothetical protein